MHVLIDVHNLIYIHVHVHTHIYHMYTKCKKHVKNIYAVYVVYIYTMNGGFNPLYKHLLLKLDYFCMQ